jgi:redox-sensitive bicupin YhaK (pirin superfamily)
MWIIPSQRNLKPEVEQKVFTKEDRTDRLLEVISGEGGNAVLVHRDARVFVSSLNEGKQVEHAFRPGHGAYLYVISGSISLNDDELSTGDAAKIGQEERIVVRALAPSELIMVEVELEAAS